MSLSVVPCRCCGKISIPPGQVSASLELAASAHCPACYESPRQVARLHFCSAECLVQFVRSTDGVATEAGYLRRGADEIQRRIEGRTR